MERIKEAASLLVSHWMSTMIDEKVAVRLTNAKKSACLIKKTTQNAALSVVTPEQSKFIKAVNMSILSMILEGDPNKTI